MAHNYDVYYVDSNGAHQYAEFESPLTRYELLRECSKAAADGRQFTLTDSTGVERAMDPASIVRLRQR